MPRRAASNARTLALQEVARIVRWYVSCVHGRIEGPGCTPFFADPSQVGPFAVDVAALKARDDNALFALLVLMGLYQSRRDVDIMRIQRTMPAGSARSLTRDAPRARLPSPTRCEPWARARECLC